MAALQELDRIIAEQWKQLEAHKKKLIENALDREKYQMRKLQWYNNLEENDRKEEDKRIKQHFVNDLRLERLAGCRRRLDHFAVKDQLQLLEIMTWP
jgi:hypothetical protein